MSLKPQIFTQTHTQKHRKGFIHSVFHPVMLLRIGDWILIHYELHRTPQTTQVCFNVGLSMSDSTEKRMLRSEQLKKDSPEFSTRQWKIIREQPDFFLLLFFLNFYMISKSGYVIFYSNTFSKRQFWIMDEARINLFGWQELVFGETSQWREENANFKLKKYSNLVAVKKIWTSINFH